MQRLVWPSWSPPVSPLSSAVDERRHLQASKPAQASQPARPASQLGQLGQPASQLEPPRDPDVVYFQDGKSVTLFVPTEDSIFVYTTLEQSVVLDLKELEVKNPNMGTIDELMKRIMDGPPGQDLDRSLIEGEDPLAMKLTGGTSLLSMPSSMEVREFSVKDWLVDDAKEPDAEGGGGGATEEDSQAKEEERLAREEQEAKSFGVGQIWKARNEKEIELASLADRMQDAIAQSAEKLGECPGSESE